MRLSTKPGSAKMCIRDRDRLALLYGGGKHQVIGGDHLLNGGAVLLGQGIALGGACLLYTSKVDKDKCTGCGACANICPKQVIMIDAAGPRKPVVMCSNKDKGCLLYTSGKQGWT